MENGKQCRKPARVILSNYQRYCRQHAKMVQQSGPQDLKTLKEAIEARQQYCGDCGHMKQYHAHGICYICRGQAQKHEFKSK